MAKFAQGEGDSCQTKQSVNINKPIILSHTTQIRPKHLLLIYACAAPGTTTLFITKGPCFVRRQRVGTRQGRDTTRTRTSKTREERAPRGIVDDRLEIRKKHPFQGAPRRGPAKGSDAAQAQQENTTGFLCGAGSAAAAAALDVGRGRSLSVAGWNGGRLCRRRHRRPCCSGDGRQVHGRRRAIRVYVGRPWGGGVMRRLTAYFLSFGHRGVCVSSHQVMARSKTQIRTKDDR